MVRVFYLLQVCEKGQYKPEFEFRVTTRKLKLIIFLFLSKVIEFLKNARRNFPSYSILYPSLQIYEFNRVCCSVDRINWNPQRRTRWSANTYGTPWFDFLWSQHIKTIVENFHRHLIKCQEEKD
uniref:Uncharacterized protein n=1 Tax=Octopus bimaculoides TaxID=37653 RepID=A0A0L8IBG7_OCTBM